MNQRPKRPNPRARPKAKAGPRPGAKRPPRPDLAPFEGAGPKPRPGRPPATVARPPRARASALAPAVKTAPVVQHVAPVEVLAGSAVEIAGQVEQAVFRDKKRADRALAAALRPRHDLAPPDRQFLSQAVFALFRWHGWIAPLRLPSLDERLLLAWLLDSPNVHPVCRAWARAIGRDPARLSAVGDAPNWTARAEGLKRWVDGRPVTADPWRNFPDWFREVLPLPPGIASPKLKYLEFLHVMQQRPSLWVRAQGADEQAVWAELAEAGIKPWVHRKLTRAAKVETLVDVHLLPAFTRGELEIQDLASQLVGLVCDPDPGDRWWDACAGAGGKALHLAALMGGKGLVVATDTHEGRLKETVRRARRSPFRNLTTKPWDGKHVAGKTRSFDGVLVDAPCSAIGTWRRNPDARWVLDRPAIARLAELQLPLLTAGSAGVKVGGALVYSVCTLTPAETLGVVQAFLATHPDFRLDPFSHPLHNTPTDGTVLIWPQEADSDAMFIARMVRTA